VKSQIENSTIKKTAKNMCVIIFFSIIIILKNH